MRRRIAHHNDGTWRMDWLTFCELGEKRIVDHLNSKPYIKPRRSKKVRSLVMP